MFLRPKNSKLIFRHYDEAAVPKLDFFLREHFRKAGNNRQLIGRVKTQEQDSVMCPGCEFSGIGKSQVLRDEEPCFRLSRAPNFSIGPTVQSFLKRGVNIAAKVFQERYESGREVLIQLNFHRTRGTSGTGRSSSADVAANAMAALTSSGFNVGYPARISSVDSPAAKPARTARSRTRVPLKTGAPPQI